MTSSYLYGVSFILNHQTVNWYGTLATRVYILLIVILQLNVSLFFCKIRELGSTNCELFVNNLSKYIEKVGLFKK